MRALLAALAIVTLGCRSERHEPPPAVIAPPVAKVPSGPKLADALKDAASWTAGRAACPVSMSALPPTKGKNIGDLALEQGRKPGQIDLHTVKSLADAPMTFGAPTDAVHVLYVETRHVAPTIAADDTFTPGLSEGTAYVWDVAASRFACIASVRATSSPEVTALGHEDRSALLWLAIDLETSIERAIVANARSIEAPSADAGADAMAVDAGRKTVR